MVVAVAGVVVSKVLRWTAALLNMVVAIELFLAGIWAGVTLADADIIAVANIVIAFEFVVIVPDFLNVSFDVLVAALSGVPVSWSMAGFVVEVSLDASSNVCAAMITAWEFWLPTPASAPSS